MEFWAPARAPESKFRDHGDRLCLWNTGLSQCVGIAPAHFIVPSALVSRAPDGGPSIRTHLRRAGTFYMFGELRNLSLEHGSIWRSFAAGRLAKASRRAPSNALRLFKNWSVWGRKMKYFSSQKLTLSEASQIGRNLAQVQQTTMKGSNGARSVLRSAKSQTHGPKKNGGKCIAAPQKQVKFIGAPPIWKQFGPSSTRHHDTKHNPQGRQVTAQRLPNPTSFKRIPRPKPQDGERANALQPFKNWSVLGLKMIYFSFRKLTLSGPPPVWT